jgi:NAD+ kinase
MEMKRASIISKQGRPQLATIVRSVASWLHDHGYSLTADKVTREYWPQAEPAEREELVEQHPDFVVVLGGDGTLLSTARSVAHAGIPILGVNLGSLGFLTEIRHDEINEALVAVDAGKCDLSLRSLLHCQVRRGDECLANYDALNECVLNQSAVARINEFELLIDGVFVANYKADGLIISTPTGSTAYSLAAGGPILSPDLPGFVITPVASHALTNRPLVVPDTAVIEARLGFSRQQGYLSVDGQLGEPLQDGDVVYCRRSKFQVRLFKMPQRSFYDVLRSKLKWGER